MRFAPFGAAALILSGCGATDLSKIQDVNEVFSWRQSIVFTSVPEVGYSGETFGSGYYQDIMSHAERKIEGYSPMTNAHETNHMLNSQVREATVAADNTVYFEAGKAALVLEPQTNARRIREVLPDYVKQKSTRYQLYVVNQVDRDWPNILYQFDEWGAYRTDSRVAKELDQAGTLASAGNGEICIADGVVDFLYFATAAVRALSQDEPQYLRSNLQFKSVFAFLAEQSMELYGYGKGRGEFDCTGSDLLNHYKNSPENAANRAALTAWMGSAWTQKVLGF